MDLLGDSQQLPPQRQRVDGAIVFRRFTSSIQASGGDQTCYRDSVVAETEELFDCSVTELYESTGGKINNRRTLPQYAQEAYMANESFAAHRLNATDFEPGDQDDINQQIVDVVRNQSRQTRRWLPW